MASLIYTGFILLLQSVSDTAEPPSPGRGPGNGDPEGPQLPIDDNLWILIIVGLLFGVYILYKRSQATNKAS